MRFIWLNLDLLNVYFRIAFRPHRVTIFGSRRMRDQFMLEAVQLAHESVKKSQGGPFGAIIVKDNKVIGRGNNQVLATNDPTAHAEIVAIREASYTLNSFWLKGCEIYSSCEPCPMCLGAIYWARLDKIYFAANRSDAAAIGFDDSFFYEELSKNFEQRNIKMVQLLREKALVPFNEWTNLPNKIPY